MSSVYIILAVAFSWLVGKCFSDRDRSFVGNVVLGFFILLGFFLIQAIFSSLVLKIILGVAAILTMIGLLRKKK